MSSEVTTWYEVRRYSHTITPAQMVKVNDKTITVRLHHGDYRCSKRSTCSNYFQSYAEARAFNIADAQSNLDWAKRKVALYEEQLRKALELPETA